MFYRWLLGFNKKVIFFELLKKTSTHSFGGTAPTTRTSYAIGMQKHSIGITSGKKDKDIHHICFRLQYPEYPIVMPKTKHKIQPLGS